MLHGAVPDSSHVVSGPSRMHGDCVLKEELEWRRGGVQSARVEWWAGPGRRVRSRRGQRLGGGVEKQEADRRGEAWAETRSRRWEQEHTA